MSFYPSAGTHRTLPRGLSERSLGDNEYNPKGRPEFKERVRSFSPSARKSGEDILRGLKEQLSRDRDMFFSNTPDWINHHKSPMFGKVSSMGLIPLIISF